MSTTSGLMRPRDENATYSFIESCVHNFYPGCNSYEHLFGEVTGYLLKNLPHISRNTTITGLDFAIRRVLRDSGYRWGESE